MTPTILALLLAAGLPVPPQASQLPPWYHWLFEAFRPAGGGSGAILTVTGISPLALVNAMAAPIHSLTQYGKCVQNGTPTPSAPVDILCNNGVLRYGALGSNLYDPSTAVFEVGYYYSPAAEGAQTAAANNFIYHAYIPIEAGAAYVFYGRKKDTNRISQYNRIHFYDAEKTYISTNTYVAGTIGTGVAPDNAVYARLSCNPQGASTAISEETVLSYNWTFCKGTAEVVPFVPFEGGVKPVGTPEVLTIRGENLLDPSESNIAIGEIYSQGGEQVSSQNNWRTGFIPIEGGKTYAFWGRKKSDNTISAYNRINWFDADGNNISPRPSYTVDTVTVGTAPSNAAFAGLSCAPNNSSAAITRATFDLFDWMFAEAAQEIPYEPYVTPQTISDVPTLFSVDTVKDEWEAIYGPLTHRIGLYVITGSDDEGWEENSSYAGTFYADCLPAAALITTFSMFTRYEGVLGSRSVGSMANGTAKCGSSSNRQRIFIRDVSCANVDALKAKLSGFYAAGEPCIVAFALATEQTEQTTPHSLHSYNGTTIVTAQTNVDPVELSLEYKGVVT